MIPDLPSHPILNGISSFSGGLSSYHNTIALAPDATQVAHWSNDVPLIATKSPSAGSIVGLNFYPPSTDFSIGFWDATTDGDLIMANALLWVANYHKTESKPSRGNHELVTLLTNPMDNSGVRTMDLNYYLNDPVIWGTDIKNITVWLESEIFDLARARQTVRLPAGFMLLKDYNIRLMMKIVYISSSLRISYWPRLLWIMSTPSQIHPLPSGNTLASVVI